MSNASEMRELVGTARKFSAQFGALIKAADILEGVVSIEAAVEESKARLDKAQRDEVELKAKHAKWEADARETANQITSAAQAGFAQRQAEAEQYVAEAKTRAVAEAEAAAAGVRANVAATEQRHAELTREIAGLTAEHAKHHADVEALTHTSGELEQLIRKLRLEHGVVVEQHQEFLRRIGAASGS
jgi:chromosome segregation ATPase